MLLSLRKNGLTSLFKEVRVSRNVERGAMGPKVITHTHFCYLGINFPNCTGHLLHRAFWQEFFCVIQGLRKVPSVKVPITHSNRLGINFPVARTFVTQRIVSELPSWTKKIHA